MIKGRQLEEEISLAITQLLEGGNIPTYEKVMSIVNSKFSREPGLPNFTPKFIKPYTVSVPSDINDMFSTLLRDLTIAFKEKRYQEERILSMVNAYDVEKRRTWGDINRQSSLLDSIRKYTSKEVHISSGLIVNTFSDFVDIDMDGNELQSIPETTCMIDLKQQKVYNWRNRRRINTVGSIITMTTNASSFIDVSPISNSLSDIVSDTWVSTHKSKDTTCSIVVSITLESITTANSIMLSLLPNNNEEITLLLSKDGITFDTQSSSLISNNKIEWNFVEQDIKTVRFVITKNEPDGYMNSFYEFFFGVENIAIYNDSYSYPGSLATVEYYIKDAEAIILDTVQVIYPNTSIIYYIVFHVDDKIEWKEILPIKNNNIEKYKLVIPDHLLIKGKYSGSVRLIAQFEGKDVSPQLYQYTLIPIGG